MNQQGKLALGIVLLIVAAVIVVLQVRRLTHDPDKNQMLSDGQQAAQTQLGTLFGKVNGKWNNDALWVDKASAKTGAAVGKEVFGDSPSMDNVKIIDARKDEENRDQDQINVVLQVGDAEQCVLVYIRKHPKSGDYVFATIEKSTMTVKEYKERL